jgi:hypothetical protein
MVHVSKRAFEIMVIVIFQNFFAEKYIKIIFYFKKIILTSTHQSWSKNIKKNNNLKKN